MDPKDLIETYVEDVLRRLPRAQRADVGFELRALLNEELQGKAQGAGRAADEAMALDLLRAFGRPEDVSARYRPTPPPIVEGRHARTFILVALIGVAVQWAVSLPVVFSRPGDPLAVAGAWWVTGGLGALWWPGFLVVTAIVSRWIGQRRRELAPWNPRIVDRDRINRPLWALGIVVATLGAATLVFLPWLIDTLLPAAAAPHVGAALAYDPDFRAGRGPWVLVLWAAQVALYAYVFVKGRWRPVLRRADLAIAIAFAALMGWWVLAGPIFQRTPADNSVKFALLLLILLIGVDAGLKLWRGPSGITPPRVLA
jgi:hypothetical protein